MGQTNNPHPSTKGLSTKQHEQDENRQMRNDYCPMTNDKWFVSMNNFREPNGPDKQSASIHESAIRETTRTRRKQANEK
jgi:hypothetical protein